MNAAEVHQRRPELSCRLADHTAPAGSRHRGHAGLQVQCVHRLAIAVLLAQDTALSVLRAAASTHVPEVEELQLSTCPPSRLQCLLALPRGVHAHSIDELRGGLRLGLAQA